MEGLSDELAIERKLESRFINIRIYLDLFDLFIWLELPPRVLYLMLLASGLVMRCVIDARRFICMIQG
jgi:hypothetical protein